MGGFPTGLYTARTVQILCFYRYLKSNVGDRDPVLIDRFGTKNPTTVIGVFAGSDYIVHQLALFRR